MTWIVDASVVVKWFLDEPGSAEASRLIGIPLSAPDLMIPECLHALTKRVRGGQLTAQVAELAAASLQRSGVTLEPTQPLAEDILALSLRLSHSAYDCAYLAVARKLDGVLITADEKLIARCQRADATDLAPRVRSLYQDLPMVQERPAHPYIARRKAA